MAKDISNRYDKNENGELIIKISTTNIEDLYENYDKKSSFIKKDLDHKLEDYLFESVKEINDYPFVVEFYFKNGIDEASSNSLKTSIKEYFEYLQIVEKNSMKENLKNSLLFILIGFILISLSFNIQEKDGFLYQLISEGSMVGGWVALWEAMTIILVNWLPLKKRLKIFKKITKAKIFCFNS